MEKASTGVRKSFNRNANGASGDVEICGRRHDSAATDVLRWWLLGVAMTEGVGVLQDDVVFATRGGDILLDREGRMFRRRPAVTRMASASNSVGGGGRRSK